MTHIRTSPFDPQVKPAARALHGLRSRLSAELFELENATRCAGEQRA
jgi:hypothetical protein